MNCQRRHDMTPILFVFDGHDHEHVRAVTFPSGSRWEGSRKCKRERSHAV